MVDKQRLYDLLVASLEEDFGSKENIAETSRDTACELEGRNQSRYDTMRIETSWVASGLDKRAEEARRELVIARSFRLPERNGRITNGSYVECSVNGAREDYFILPFYGGRDVDDGEVEYLVVTPETPLAKELIGRSDGDEFDLRGRHYTIVEHS